MNVEMPLLVSRTKAGQARGQAEAAIEMVGLGRMEHATTPRSSQVDSSRGLPSPGRW